MNASSEKVNALQTQLDQQLDIHRNFIVNFSKNLEIAKQSLSDKELKNAEQFYLIMHRGKLVLQLFLHKDWRRSGVEFIPAKQVILWFELDHNMSLWKSAVGLLSQNSYSRPDWPVTHGH